MNSPLAYKPPYWAVEVKGPNGDVRMIDIERGSVIHFGNSPECGIHLPLAEEPISGEINCRDGHHASLHGYHAPRSGRGLGNEDRFEIDGYTFTMKRKVTESILASIQNMFPFLLENTSQGRDYRGRAILGALEEIILPIRTLTAKGVWDTLQYLHVEDPHGGCTYVENFVRSQERNHTTMTNSSEFWIALNHEKFNQMVWFTIMERTGIMGQIRRHGLREMKKNPTERGGALLEGFLNSNVKKAHWLF